MYRGFWKLSIRNAFKNFRRDRPVNENVCPRKATSEPQTKKIRAVVEDAEEVSEEDYEIAVSKLKKEYAKNRKGKNHATIKNLMEVTRQRRWKWILEQSPLVSEVIEEFPFLVFGKVVSNGLFILF